MKNYPGFVGYLLLLGLGFFPACNSQTAKSENLLSPIVQSVDNPAPISPNTFAFMGPEVVDSIAAPTRLAWGPDGRLYVATLDGLIYAYEFDENYAVLKRHTYDAISHLSNHFILGLGFNPFDGKLYVAHAELFTMGADCYLPEYSPYSGQISILEGETRDQLIPLITGLPASKLDRAPNGFDFDDLGDLFLSQGGQTNAGVPACPLGFIPESPLTSAVLKFPISRADFNGAIYYVETQPPHAVSTDQTFGDRVDVAAGVDVSVVGPGLRNSFDLIWSTRSKLLATDNGAGLGYGPQAIGPGMANDIEVHVPDEWLHIVEGNYYGHANWNRGRSDSRQNIYYPATASSIWGTYTEPVRVMESSVNGIDEYRSLTFGGAMRGTFLLQKFNSYTVVLQPDAAGIRPAWAGSIPAVQSGLDVISGPEGVILVTDYASGTLNLYRPGASAFPAGTTALDIFPWRARGGARFVIAGRNFGTLADTKVLFQGKSAQLESVTGKRISGWIPSGLTPAAALMDVTVISNGNQSILPEAFRALPASDEPFGVGRWLSGTPSTELLSEVGMGVIHGILYVVGINDNPQTTANTFAYDISRDTWRSDLAARPFPGNHHPVEVFNGKLYLMGGLYNGAEGKVQIYDPVANSWTLGADIPSGTGSAATAVIGDYIYYAGGLANLTAPVPDSFRYEPKTDSWMPIAPMPKALHHTASGTDGQRLFIFGGRTGPNDIHHGWEDVQIYDPATDSWEWSGSPGSTIPPLPVRRSGMGKAPYYRGEFYVITGETTDSGPEIHDGIVHRVDVYNPVATTWRQETVPPTPRHGIYPITWGDKIYMALGNNHSTVIGPSHEIEIFNR